MRKTQSPILDAVHGTAQGLHKAGAMDQVTLRESDGVSRVLCWRTMFS
jgi:putative transcriptional regulator